MEKFPSPTKIWASVLLLWLIEDFFFNMHHRFLHMKFIYPYIHKIHHQYVDSVGIASIYAHPVEFVLGNILPTALAGMILEKHIHFFAFLCFVFIRICDSVRGHSGYEFPWCPYSCLPFFIEARYHDFHHAYNVGTYSSLWILWDFLLDDCKDYLIHEYYNKEKTLK